MLPALKLLGLAGHNPAISAFVVTGFKSTHRLAPRGHRMTSTRRFTFTTTMRGIDRVHLDAAIVRQASEPARTTGLTQRNVFMLHIADLPDRRHALERHAADF